MKKFIALATIVFISMESESLLQAKPNYLPNIADYKTRYEISKNIENAPVISDSAIKELLVNGDEAFKNILKTNVCGKSYVDVSGITYAPLTEDLSKYSSIYEYLSKNYILNNYYTDRFVKSMATFLFIRINNNYYMRYGDPESRLMIKNSEVISKKYEFNKVHVSLKGYYSDDVSYASATLVFNGDKWLIDNFDNWGIK